MPPKRRGWIGIDLDGTLAHYEKWRGIHHVGEPIPAMVERVKRWLADGWEVRICTARVAVSATKPLRETEDAKKAIDTWCLAVFGRLFVITCRKDLEMVELWDDRVVTVEKNTGKQLTNSEVEGPASFSAVVEEELRESLKLALYAWENAHYSVAGAKSLEHDKDWQKIRALLGMDEVTEDG